MKHEREIYIYLFLKLISFIVSLWLMFIPITEFEIFILRIYLILSINSIAVSLSLFRRDLPEFNFLKYNSILEISSMFLLFFYFGYNPVITLLMFPYGLLIVVQTMIHSKNLDNHYWIILIGIFMIILACDQVGIISLFGIIDWLADLFGQIFYMEISLLNLFYYISFNIFQSIAILVLPCIVVILLPETRAQSNEET